VGPGGSYMGRKHTKARMKTTAVLPKLANRDMRQQWEDAGRPTIHDRALAEARRILAQPNEAVWDAELDARIREHFAGLVAGDATPLEG
jgi:trimethylamine--corrinoid protein Co-methyltransferase